MSKPAKGAKVEQPDYPKADMVHRAVGRFADVVIALLLARLLPGLVAPIVAIGYLLLADGLLKGQSLGKRLAGLKVVNRRTRRDALYRESIVRNLPFAVVALFSYLPILGLVLFPVGGLFVFAFELYMAWSDRLGLRIGDVLAETQVIDGSVPVESSEPANLRSASRSRASRGAAASPEPEGAA